MTSFSVALALKERAQLAVLTKYYNFLVATTGSKLKAVNAAKMVISDMMDRGDATVTMYAKFDTAITEVDGVPAKDIPVDAAMCATEVLSCESLQASAEEKALFADMQMKKKAYDEALAKVLPPYTTETQTHITATMATYAGHWDSAFVNQMKTHLS